MWNLPRGGGGGGGDISLIEYTHLLFINSLIVSLRNSGKNSSIYMTPSMPVGYADDLATCSLLKYKMDKILDILYNHMCDGVITSTLLVYGESKLENSRNAQIRIFKLGQDRVHEHINYDYVGVRGSIFVDDVSGLEEQARRAFYLTSDLDQWAQILPEYHMNAQFWSEYSGPIIFISATFRS